MHRSGPANEGRARYGCSSSCISAAILGITSANMSALRVCNHVLGGWCPLRQTGRAVLGMALETPTPKKSDRQVVVSEDRYAVGRTISHPVAGGHRDSFSDSTRSP